MDLEHKQCGGKRWLRWGAVVLIGSWLLAAGYLVGLPEEVLTTNLIVDDSLYFTVPARNFWLGRGLSFDGVELTNGVQTLWMLVTLLLAGLISDPMTMLRSLVLTSALCWLLAAIGIFRLLRPRSLAAAVFAANGFAWAGVHGRLAFMGMENGATALVSVIVLAVGIRVVQNGCTPRGCLALGAAIALCALNRTEGVLLGPIVAVPLLLGWLGQHSVAVRVQRVALLALPGILVIGTVLIVHRITFDLWLPISGTVKSFYEQEWADRPVHDGLFANIGWHVRRAVVLAVAPLREDLSALLASVTWTKVRLWRNLVWAILALVMVRGLWSSWRERSGDAVRRPRFGAVFGFFAGVHVVLMGVMLPHFTNYGTWYFAGEAVAVWFGIGVAFATLRGRWVTLPWMLAGLTTVAGLCSVADVSRDVTTGHLRQGGIWLEKNVAPGSVVGSLSSGLAAWYAPSLHVVNLDGLINNRRYFDDFLSKQRVGDYFEDRGIEWFGDYSTLQGWRRGFSWCGHIPASRMVPRVYSRMSDQRAYAVWRVLRAGETFELLQDHPGIERDRYVELGVAADVYGRFPVVDAGDLQQELARNPRLVVARSIVEDPPMRLLHVLATAAELEDIALTQETVWPATRVAANVGGGVQLLGFDQKTARVAGRRHLAVTFYWQRAATELSTPMPESLQFEVRVPGKPLQPVPVGTCHGTRPMSDWPLDQVVVETVMVDLGAESEFDLVIRAGERELLELPNAWL